MLTIDRSARTTVPAPPQRCLERLGDVEGYPSWSSLIKRTELVGGHVRMEAEMLGVGFVMDCALELGSDRAVLRRVPYSLDDDELYEARWTVTPEGDASLVELHVAAAIDVPRPARLVRGRIERRMVDDLLSDFASSVW